MNRKRIERQPIKPPKRRPLTSIPDITNLPNCVEDSRQAFLDSEVGPENPTNYNELLGRLEASREKLPPLYRDTVFKPFVDTLRKLGQDGFIQILLSDPNRERAAGLTLDIAHAILQNGERYNERATDGYQEVVSDLYDGFLSAEDRKGVKPPDMGVIPPLVKWGNPTFGPYTWPVDATLSFKVDQNDPGVQAAIVNLPPSHARRGILGWAALGHETGGHDILHADTGLTEELSSVIHSALQEQGLEHGLPEYWADRIDETASDVLGILNMGPAAGIGIIGYFRGINAAFTGEPKLRNEGSLSDPHPADILRGYLAASAVRLLSFDGADKWADLLAEETAKDVSQIQIDGTEISDQESRQSADIVAKALIQTKAVSLENHALGEIQDWRNIDEDVVKQLRVVLSTPGELPPQFASGFFAAHTVAAAVTAAISSNANIPLIFDRMLAVLKIMHDTNPSWGPLFVVHPGNISSHRAFIFTQRR